KNGEMAAATILSYKRYVILQLTWGHFIVVAAGARSSHQVVINLVRRHRRKCSSEVTSATLRLHRDMVHRLANRADPIMTSSTCTSDFVVVESRRLPAEIRVAIDTIVLHRNVADRLTRHNDVVVAVLTTAKDFVVIHHRYRLPCSGVMAAITSLAGKNMLDRLGRRIDAAIDAVTGGALSGRTLELAIGVAALTGYEIVPAG